MFVTYKTDYSNHVHQLIVSVSRHYYVTREGKYKYQKKPFEVQLENLTSPKTHIVHYLIRDHFSGLFYAEIVDSKNLICIFDFLKRAWTGESEFPFGGIPWGITVPKNVQRLWPDLVPWLIGLKMEVIEVTSGFQGGIRDVRTWETRLNWAQYDSGFPPDYSEVRSKAINTCLEIATWSARGEETRKEKWLRNLKRTDNTDYDEV